MLAEPPKTNHQKGAEYDAAGNHDEDPEQSAFAFSIHVRCYGN